MRSAGLVSALHIVCTTFCVKNGVKCTFQRRNISKSKEITSNYRYNRVNVYEFREARPVSKLETASIANCA